MQYVGGHSRLHYRHWAASECWTNLRWDFLASFFPHRNRRQSKQGCGRVSEFLVKAGRKENDVTYMFSETTTNPDQDVKIFLEGLKKALERRVNLKTRRDFLFTSLAGWSRLFCIGLKGFIPQQMHPLFQTSQRIPPCSDMNLIFTIRNSYYERIMQWR